MRPDSDQEIQRALDTMMRELDHARDNLPQGATIATHQDLTIATRPPEILIVNVVEAYVTLRRAIDKKGEALQHILEMTASYKDDGRPESSLYRNIYQMASLVLASYPNE